MGSGQKMLILKVNFVYPISAFKFDWPFTYPHRYTIPTLPLQMQAVTQVTHNQFLCVTYHIRPQKIIG